MTLTCADIGGRWGLPLLSPGVRLSLTPLAGVERGWAGRVGALLSGDIMFLPTRSPASCAVLGAGRQGGGGKSDGDEGREGGRAWGSRR
ncbi:hypothetical protein E2C01_078807 [Portunus trituberculatus]|uniref:Uncharacterized protein n=1 Tax=Portunus trituberculatus TaxID=210409 RepID=A0A5B7IFB8_PORTR|nr:hypothetical protein [Portunus trituberculatus]